MARKKPKSSTKSSEKSVESGSRKQSTKPENDLSDDDTSHEGSASDWHRKKSDSSAGSIVEKKRESKVKSRSILVSNRSEPPSRRNTLMGSGPIVRPSILSTRTSNLKKSKKKKTESVEELEDDEWEWEYYYEDEVKETKKAPSEKTDKKSKKSKKGKKVKMEMDKTEDEEADDGADILALLPMFQDADATKAAEPVEKEGKKKKGKKGKKDKKGKKEKKEGEEGKPKKEKKEKKGAKGKKKKASADPVLAEFNKIRKQNEKAELEKRIEVWIKGGKKGKKPKKIKPKKEEVRRILENYNRELETFRKLKKKQEKEMALKAKKDLKDKIIKEGEEQKVRVGMLMESSKRNIELAVRRAKFKAEKKEKEEWIRYFDCDGFPDAHDIPMLNTYIHMWQMTPYKESEDLVETVATKASEVLRILDGLQDILDDPFGYAPQHLVNVFEQRNLFRLELHDALDGLTYFLLRHYEDSHNKFDRIKLKAAKFVEVCDAFALCLWVWARLPIPYPRSDDTAIKPKQLVVEFPEINATVTLPISYDCYCTSLRLMWQKFDHKSDYAKSHALPGLPSYLCNADLNEMVQGEYVEVSAITDKAFEEEGVHDKPSSSHIPLLTASQMFEQKEDDVYLNGRKGMKLELLEHEVNLRNKMMVGGCIVLNIFAHPPQLKDCRRNLEQTVLKLPKNLETIYFYEPYKPPPPPTPPATPPPGSAVEEEEEEEVSLPEPADLTYEQSVIEERLNKLIRISIELPKSVMWFEQPIICRWENTEFESDIYPDELPEKYWPIEQGEKEADRSRMSWAERVSASMRDSLTKRLSQVRASVLSADTKSIQRRSSAAKARLSLRRSSGQDHVNQEPRASLMLALERHLSEDEIKDEKEETLDYLNVEQRTVEGKPREEFMRTGFWSLKDVHGLTYDDEKHVVTFRTSKLGTFGFAANRFLNLPFQHWEFGPNEKMNGVTFTLTAAIVSLEFELTKDGVCLKSIEGGPKWCQPLKEIYGNFYKLSHLIIIMRSAGVDIFPEPDSFTYTEVSCEKHWPMEKHLCSSIAFYAMSHNFAWSKWNFKAGRRNIVLLMREVLGKKHLPGFKTLHVTPLKANIVDCHEEDAKFNSKTLFHGFYPDFNQLCLEVATPLARRKSYETHPEIQAELMHLLQATRIFSYC